MNTIPLLLYSAWVVIIPMLLVIAHNSFPLFKNPIFYLFTSLAFILAAVFLYFDLLDMKQGEGFAAYYRRKKAEEKLADQEELERVQALGALASPDLCCRCGKAIEGGLEHSIKIHEKPFYPWLEKMLKPLGLLSARDQWPEVTLKAGICPDCKHRVTRHKTLTEAAQYGLIGLGALVGLYLGWRNANFEVYLVMGVAVGFLLAAAAEGLIDKFAGAEFYKVDWKHRFIRFTNPAYQAELIQKNPTFPLKP